MSLEVEAHVVQRAALAVADGDHEARAREHHHLADLDRLGAVHVPGGLEHEKQRAPNTSSFGRWWAWTASSTASGCSSKRVPTASTTSGLGSWRPIQTKPSWHESALRERGVQLDQAALSVPLVVDTAIHDGRADVLVHVRRAVDVRRGGVAAQQRDPGETVRWHVATLLPSEEPVWASSRHLDPARENLHAPFTSAT